MDELNYIERKGTNNTLTTPAAGQFQIKLPDGSKV